MTSELRARLEALADRMEPALMGTPPDCHDECAHGPCVCSGARPVFAWSGVSPDDLRALLAELEPADCGDAEALSEQAHALAMDISGCLSNVSDLPDWMRIHALGRLMTPIVELVTNAVVRSRWLADLRRTERAEGAREAAERIAVHMLLALNAKTWTPQWGRDDWRLWLRTELARAATEATTTRPTDGDEAREVGGRG